MKLPYSAGWFGAHTTVLCIQQSAKQPLSCWDLREGEEKRRRAIKDRLLCIYPTKKVREGVYVVRMYVCMWIGLAGGCKEWKRRREEKSTLGNVFFLSSRDTFTCSRVNIQIIVGRRRRRRFTTICKEYEWVHLTEWLQNTKNRSINVFFNDSLDDNDSVSVCLCMTSI